MNLRLLDGVLGGGGRAAGEAVGQAVQQIVEQVDVCPQDLVELVLHLCGTAFHLVRA